MNVHIAKQQLTDFVREREFFSLFIELGWDKKGLPAEALNLKLSDEEILPVLRIAEKRGFVVCVCDAGEHYPEHKADRHRLVKQLARYHYEHLLIICGKGKQCWTVAIRPQNLPLRTAEVEWNETQDIQPLMGKLDGLIFDISEEETLGITDVVDRVRHAFIENAERITRNFYSEFSKELSTFSEFIEGIKQQVSQDWYAALMLNRLMFIYFIQKRRFLGGDINYLENRLNRTKEKYGADEFHNRFYRHFLRRLFAEGLGTPASERKPELTELLGNVPYLNGGLFDIHEIEEQNQEIQIPDEAFEKLFTFFERYNWHLDSRPTSSGRDINPDVIGYIFEKYINERAEMGAYYTQEDITGYISRNTIIPFLLNRAKEKCANAFDPKNGIWRFLREHPDNYIYESVRKGCDILDDQLPDNIRCGIDTKSPNLIERRKDWNTPTEKRFALPTEIWRETMARRKRYFELKAKIERGEICTVDDLITYNLDIQRFASDALRYYEGSDFIAAFFHSIAGRKAIRSNQRAARGITILDPACGSGAFLFAALGVLEPLYEQCIARMREFVEEDDHLHKEGARKGTKKHPQFREFLQEIAAHPNERYWIYKTIILNNLYGVDLMREATEIAKLRLFLKLAAEAEYDSNKSNLGLEPLPDIDFNIRSGNSLVGFTSMAEFEKLVEQKLDFGDIDEIREEAQEVQKASERFREAQDENREEYRQAKQGLHKRLDALNKKMNRYLASQYKQDSSEKSITEWQESHRPFHWLIEFYGIIEEDRGFDVVIGNPPYVEYRKVQDYTIQNYKTRSCGNLYAFFMERSKWISNQKGFLSMIVPLSGHSTKRMTSLMDSFYNSFRSCHLFNISADAHPSILFPGVKFRLAIFIASNFTANITDGMFTTGYSRWYARQRDTLFDLLAYTNIGNMRYKTAIPKVSTYLHLKILQKLVDTKEMLDHTTAPRKKSEYIVRYHSAPVNWVRSHTEIPYFHSERDGEKASVELKFLYLDRDERIKKLQAMICSTVFFIWWISHSDCYHLNSPEIVSFPECSSNDLNSLSQKLEENMKANSSRRIYNYQTTGRVEYDEFYMKESKQIIDQIDIVLAQHYGFTEEELDYIINYDIKYRMGLSNV